MLTDLLTSSKGPGVIGTLLALVVLVGFGGLMLVVSNDSSSGKSLASQIKAKEGQIKTAEARIEQWKDAAVDYEAGRKQKNELESLQKSHRRKLTEVTNAESSVEEAKAKVAKVGEDFEDYKKKYRIAERARAAGEKMEALTTKDGKVYQEVKVIEVTAMGMKIMHKAGSTRVEYQRLPDEMQDRFQFTKEAAAAIAKKEAAQVTHSVKRADGYHKAVAIRDLRHKIRLEQEDIAKLTSKTNTLNANIRSYQSSIAAARTKAAHYRSLYSQGKRGLTLDSAKKAERLAASYQARVKRAQSEISANNTAISQAKRDIMKLEGEIKKEMKKK